MNIARNLRTASRIPTRQLAARARILLLRKLYATARTLPIEWAARDARGVTPRPVLPTMPLSVLAPAGLGSARARASAFERGKFVYLNDPHMFSVDERTGRVSIDWGPPGASALWRYQIQYLGALLDFVLAGSTSGAADVLAAWIERYATRWDATAWHPYPVSLRLSNLCLSAGAAGSFAALGPGAADLAAVSAGYVHRHLERDVRGNHLLENARALLIASRSLEGPPVAAWERTARELLAREISEQILPDGAHFELAPMYHAIVLWRLLELAALLGRGDPLVIETIDPAISAMRRFLAGVLCPDDDIPLLGDSTRRCDFAPPIASLLGTEPVPRENGLRAFPQAGLYVFTAPRLWAVLDAGPVCPEYLPAHGHADTLTVEVWCDGACLVGDPGVYSFTGPERAWGRSSRAHSTLTVDDADTSEVYGSFRIGGRSMRPTVEVRLDQVTATVVPWDSDVQLSRVVRVEGAERSAFHIVDRGRAPAGATVRSRLHLHPAAAIVSGGDGAREIVVATAKGRVRISAVHPVRLEAGRASREFGLIEKTTILVQDLRAEQAGRDVHGGWTISALGPTERSS